MTARYLISYPCEDACGTLRTGRTVDGAPVYRCPGCDSEWIELDEVVPEAADLPGEGSPPPAPDSSPGQHPAAVQRPVG